MSFGSVEEVLHQVRALLETEIIPSVRLQQGPWCSAKSLKPCTRNHTVVATTAQEVPAFPCEAEAMLPFGTVDEDIPGTDM